MDFAGPLGCASELIKMPLDELKKEKILFVCGGVGTAPVYPQVKWMKEHGVDHCFQISIRIQQCTCKDSCKK